jgi:hypothetical protein
MIHAVGISARTKTAVNAIEIGRMRRTSRGKKSISVILRPLSE